jgi:hypothetical protein
MNAEDADPYCLAGTIMGGPISRTWFHVGKTLDFRWG